MDDEMKTCVFSGSTEGLNTSMRVKLDDGVIVEVWVSDEFAESATPKLVKDAYITKHPPEDSEDMKQFKLLAAKFGFALPVPGQTIPEPSRPVLAVPPPLPTVAQPQTIKAGPPRQVQPQTIAEALNKPVLDPSNRMISGRAADGKDITNSIRVSMGDASAAAAGAPVGQYSVTSQSKPSVDLKEGEIAEIGQVRGRNGIDIAIPVRRVGKAGTTQIRVVDNGGDPTLQRRFKDMARASQSEKGVVYGRDGYESRTTRCPLCATRANAQCKKCGGLGQIEVIKPFTG